MLGADDARTFVGGHACRNLVGAAHASPFNRHGSTRGKARHAFPYDEERPFVGATHASPCGLTMITARCKASGSRQSRPAAPPAQSPIRSSTRRSRSATEDRKS